MNEHAFHLIALVISGVVVTICVVLHYEALRFLSHTVGVHVHKRIGVLVVMLGLLVAHVLEIIIFALGYIMMQYGAGLGHISGMDGVICLISFITHPLFIRRSDLGICYRSEPYAY